MKRVKWPFGPKRIMDVAALDNRVLAVQWEDGETTTVDLSAWIEASGFAALADPGVFARAHVGEYGSTVAWVDDELEIDSIHLQLLESEQKGMPLLPDALARWRARHGLSQAAAAKALGVSLRQWQNYEGGATFLPWTVALACKGWEAAKKEAA